MKTLFMVLWLASGEVTEPVAMPEAECLAFASTVVAVETMDGRRVEVKQVGCMTDSELYQVFGITTA